MDNKCAFQIQFFGVYKINKLICRSFGKTCIDEINVSFFLKDDCGYIEAVVICAEHMNLKILCG